MKLLISYLLTYFFFHRPLISKQVSQVSYFFDFVCFYTFKNYKSWKTHNFSVQRSEAIRHCRLPGKTRAPSQKIRNNDYWYLSPLREEKEASFKVNRKLNVWYDHGLGQGGNIIDFGILYHHCSFKEAMEKLQEIFSFHPQIPTVQQHYSGTQNGRDNALEPAIKVIAAKPITHPVLCRYLESRKIPLEIAEKYCKEIDFELHNKKYFAIGFENNSGGFELRNEHFKGSSSPKNVTTY